MRQLKDVIFNLLGQVQSTIYSSWENLPSDRMYQLATMGTYFLEDVSYYMRTPGKDVPVDWEPIQLEDVSISTDKRPTQLQNLQYNNTWLIHAAPKIELAMDKTIDSK